MGYVMDEINAHDSSGTIESFVQGLKPLAVGTAWSSGNWRFDETDVVPWNRVEFTPRQCQQLAEHLVGRIRSARRQTARRVKATQ